MRWCMRGSYFTKLEWGMEPSSTTGNIEFAGRQRFFLKRYPMQNEQNEQDTTPSAVVDDTKLDTIRSDLWKIMTPQQLNDQHTMVMDRLTTINLMMSGAASPTILGMGVILQHALDEITQIINSRPK